MKEKRKCLISIVYLLIFAGLTIFIIVFGRKRKLYEEYRYCESYFGKELYSEIIYTCSDYESEIGNRLVNKAVEVSAYLGVKENVADKMEDVGVLNQYYYFYRKNAASQDTTFQFVTCKINGNTGHVWVLSKSIWYDANGERIESAGEHPVLWYIEKSGDEWKVVQIDEQP
ncbi:MAG: hypothetical protein NC089_10850 [Bacteroides sp.]|nr:hypothetical protein [Bacteroides sp.]MCM1551033.1 hypothetical protein [Clostridium sp.]